MLPLRMLGPLLLMILLCDADSTCPPGLNPLTLYPPEVVREFGDTVLVNCTSTVEDHNGMYWRQTIKPDLGVEEENNFISVSILLSDWNVAAECKIKLNDSHECSKDLEITVYKNPEMVTIFPTKYVNAVEGTEYELQCDVINVAPIQNLTVTWYKDNQVIWTESFTNTNKTAVDVSSTLTRNISRGENGAQFRCEAHLDFGQHGSQPPEISEIRQVSVHYAPELKKKTDIDDVFVYEGNDVTLNCEAEGNPPPVFQWTRDGVNISENRDNLNITRVHTNATYTCTATNYLGSITKLYRVRVTQTTKTTPSAAMTTPEASAPRGCPLTLSPDEIVVRFRDRASVNCSTSATNAAGMGWEATVGGTGLENPPAVTWTVENLKEWTVKPVCFVTMNDNSQCQMGPVITLYKTPDIVYVSDHGPMVEGTEYLLNCDIISVAPVQKLKVNWYRGNEIVHTEMFNGTSVAPVSVFSILRVTPEKNDHRARFRCEAELHLGPKGPELVPNTTSLPYTAVVLYKPQLTCPGRYTGVEHKFSLDILPCEVDGNPLPNVQWYYQGEPISASEPLTRNHSGKYTAEVVNHLGRSNASVDITIEYGPSFTCNDHYKVEEDGKRQTKCEPKGMPKPTITWFKDGKEMPSPQRWTKHDSGKYLLKATNKHGTANYTLYVDVLYAPVFKKGNYTKEVTPGENVTFDCLAEGNPSPEMYWKYISTANVRVTNGMNISITGATSTNAGVYICAASNEVGKVTRSVTLIIKDKTTAGPPTLIWGLLILLIIIIILAIVVILNSRWKKHGQYSFIASKANDGSDIPMTTQSGSVHA